MDFEDEVLKKVPKEKQAELAIEFGMLLSFIRENKIKGKDQLNELLDSEIEKCRSLLSKSATIGTMSRIRREYVKKLQYLNVMKDIVERYL